MEKEEGRIEEDWKKREGRKKVDWKRGTETGREVGRNGD